MKRAEPGTWERAYQDERLRLSLLCSSLMLFFAEADDPDGGIELRAADDMGEESISQVRSILAQVNPVPDFLDDPTPEDIAALEADPEWPAQRDRLLAAGKTAFEQAWARSHAVEVPEGALP